MLIDSLEIVPLNFVFILLENFELFTGKEDGCCVGGNCWCRRSTVAAVPHPFHFAGTYTCTSTPFPHVEFWQTFQHVISTTFVFKVSFFCSLIVTKLNCHNLIEVPDKLDLLF